MKRSRISLYNNSGYGQAERCYKVIDHRGELSVKAAQRIISKKSPAPTRATLTVFQKRGDDCIILKEINII